jgi:hypothetical protein
MQAYFGPVWYQRAGGGPEVVALRAAEPHSAIIVCVRYPDGSPAQGVVVLRHWPGAPLLPPELQGEWFDTGVWALTKDNGCADFGMGTGDYYWPPQCGPSSVWVRSGDVVHCLGMVAATNHHHLDLDYRLYAAGASTCPPWMGCAFFDLLEALQALDRLNTLQPQPGPLPRP